METMTIKQALAERYTFCGHDGQEVLNHLDDLTEDELKELLKLGPVYLFSKDSASLVMDVEQVWEMIMESSELSDVGWEDTAEFLDLYTPRLQTLFNEIGEEAHRRKITNTYYQTEIRLIPG